MRSDQQHEAPPGPVLVLRFDVESAAALVGAEERSEERWPRWLEESLRGVEAIVRLLSQLDAPASFFLVGELLSRAGRQYAALLAGRPQLDIGNHTHTHVNILAPGSDPSGALRCELRRAAAEIRAHLAVEPIGFTAPGCFWHGLRGHPEMLRVLWEEGYRHITTDGQPPPGAFRRGPAPMTQPYWYADEGFPELLELPLTGWHCNMLFNSGGQNDAWPPGIGLPDGGILERLPRTPDEAFEVRRRELEYAIAHRLVYAPCMHPWSLHRFDPQLAHLRRLVQLARTRRVAICNCRQLYAHLRRTPRLDPQQPSA